MKGSKTKWTIEQEQMIRELYKPLGLGKLAERLGVSKSALQAKAHQMGVYARNIQLKHIDRLDGESDRDFLKRKLLANIAVTDSGCWEWQAGRHSFGYGFLLWKGRTGGAHRVAWELYRGPIPAGKHVCHTCDNPPCCNPDHLFLGDIKVNTADRHQKDRDAWGQKNGNSKLTDTQVTEIRQQYRGAYGQIKQLAARYDVSSDQIRNVVRGNQRMHGVKDPNWTTRWKPKMTEETVRLLRTEYDGRRGCLTRLARKYKIDVTQVKNIVERRQWKHVV